MADEPPPTEDETRETLETLQARHRKEQRDLISRITQKKKQANKKTRKGVNDECESLERELKERQEQELRALNGEVTHEELPDDDDDELQDSEPLTQEVSNLHITSNTPPPANGTTQPQKRNRAKDRLAKRAAAQTAAIREAELEAANAPNPREIERQAMATQLARRNLTLHEIRADGHCLYAAVADQLETRELGMEPRIAVKTAGEGPAYKRVRHAAAGWIESHEEDFAGFTEDPLPLHIAKIRDTGEWGGHLELQALAKAYGVRICVLHSDGREDKFEGGDDGGEEVEEVWLGYYKHSHGLGEHYNSLRKIDTS